MVSTKPARRLSSLAAIALTELSGVGPRRAAALNSLGVESVRDLLWYVPRRYIDRSTQAPIAELATMQLDGADEVTLFAQVEKSSRRQIRRRLTLFEITLADDTGTLRATWFNRPGLMRGVDEGHDVVCSGKLEFYRGRPKLNVTALEPVGRAGDETAQVVPVHGASSDASAQQIRKYVREALVRAGQLYDPIPQRLLDRYGLMGRTQAFNDVHFPPDLDTARRARDRLVYDELFMLEIGLAERKSRARMTESGFVHGPGGLLWSEFDEALPYELTGAQRRALSEISDDLASTRPMHRLLQGEVGSGKTVIAAHALLAAVDAGRQAAIMAPTAVLAEQHYEVLEHLFEGLEISAGDNLFGARPLRIGLLTNRVTGAERRCLLDDLGKGEVDVLVGTHALVQDGVSIPALGVAVIDEQHRFGVHQRVSLKERGDRTRPETPDTLIMTATPIPRTLSMTLYGDLDVSVLDELPPGRKPIRTVVETGAEGRAAAYATVRSEVAAGRQAYVICPLVTDSEQVEAKSATSEFERLCEDELAGLRVGLLHGQLAADAKRTAMNRFRRGELDVLVATTVIEVGIDVANASVMVIEDADRFGLSQLHQLRGRIGRGDAVSTCVLIADPKTPDGAARVEAMATISDGFQLAERDLEIRGEGSVFDVRQSGVSDLAVARLIRDMAWVERARSDAFAMIDDDPELTADEHVLLREEVLTLRSNAEWLERS